MLYDITQELFSGKVYPGDMAPQLKRICSMDKGGSSNISELAMNVHNATHIDAPYHKVRDGRTIEALDLEACIGECEVIAYENKERIASTDARRILFRDCECIDEATAKLLVEKKVLFVGVEGQSVGTRAVHIILLSADIVVLEGAELSHVPEGRYFLSSAPLKLGGCDGAPCRAVLIGL